jgi:SAM-dependent methyltransferase
VFLPVTDAARDHRPRPTDYDAELRLHHEVLRRSWDVRADDHILDIGCGTGQTTREVARAAVAGSALGVDVSAPAIERARELAEAQGLRNVTFEPADAQVHRFPAARFDVAISRFGTMFFTDPGTAFVNIAQALRPAGRLVMMVWQSHERNEWDVAIHQALAGPEAPATDTSGEPGPFSLADPPTVTRLLHAAGFTDVTFTDVHHPVYYGPDVATALDWVRHFTCTNDLLTSLDPTATAHALQQLRQTLATHLTDTGVWFDSRAWTVTAHHP